jgi:hypothetical protein
VRQSSLHSFLHQMRIHHGRSATIKHHFWIFISTPPCLRSDRASFVNSYGGRAQALGASLNRGPALW